MTVTALDAEDDITPNYGNELATEGIGLERTLTSPVAGDPGALSGGLTPATPSVGVFTGDINYSEVGIINLTADVLDDNYLGAGNVSSSRSGVGRFYPAQFSVSAGIVTPAHNPGGVEFTYLGEPFDVSYTLTAQASGGGVIKNYGNFGAGQNYLKLGSGRYRCCLGGCAD